MLVKLTAPSSLTLPPPHLPLQQHIHSSTQDSPRKEQILSPKVCTTMKRKERIPRYPVTLLIVAVCCWAIASVTGCNKALCASDVSKCLLQELCQCSMKGEDCPCCKDCMVCLGSIWEQCCSCVGLCSEHKGSRKHAARRSSLEALPFPLPSLFQSLSELQGDAAGDWSIHTLPVSKEISQHAHMDDILLSTHSALPFPPSVNTSAMCTVMYFKPCMIMRHCQESCEFTGSATYRWFHNGCCQCVGPDCYGYGSKEPLCQQCHPKGMLPAMEGIEE